jgi:hypothetical protein
VSTSSDQQPPGAPARPSQPSTQEIPVVAPAAAQPVTGGHHLPPPGAPQVAGTSMTAVQPTGPVDFVPGLPGPGTPPPPPPVAAPAGASAVPTGATAAPVATASEPGSAAPPTAPVTAAAVSGGARSWPESLEADGPPAAKRARTRRPGNRKALAGLGLAALAAALLQVGLLLDFASVSFWSAVTLWSAFATFSSLLALIAFAVSYAADDRLRSGGVWRIAAAGLVGLSVFWVLVVLPVVATDRGFVLTAALGCLGAALWVGRRGKD